MPFTPYLFRGKEKKNTCYVFIEEESEQRESWNQVFDHWFSESETTNHKDLKRNEPEWLEWCPLHKKGN